MTDKLVIVGVFGNSFDAQMAKISLSEHGIESIITGENLLMAAPQIGMPRIELMVLADNAEQARVFLESNKEQEH